MRQGPNGRRPRGRPNRKQHGGPSRPNTFDSAGPEGRVRGNAHQVYEKYVTLARDAMSSGDRIMAEAFFQHAEHYFRIVNASTDPEPADRRPPPRAEGQGRDGNGRDAEGRDAYGRDQGRRPSNGQTGAGREAWAQGPEAATSGPPQSAAPDPRAEAANGGAKEERTETRRKAAPQTSQAPQTRSRDEDREGLDRVLGNEKPAPRRRPRRAPARAQQENADAPAAARPRQAETEQPYPAAQPLPEHRDDGEADAKQVQAGAKANGTETAAPGDSKSDSEPVGA